MWNRKGTEIVLGKLFDQYVVKEIMSHTPQEVMMKELKQELERRSYIREKLYQYHPSNEGITQHEEIIPSTGKENDQIHLRILSYYIVASIKKLESVVMMIEKRIILMAKSGIPFDNEIHYIGGKIYFEHREINLTPLCCEYYNKYIPNNYKVESWHDFEKRILSDQKKMVWEILDGTRIDIVI